MERPSKSGIAGAAAPARGLGRAVLIATVTFLAILVVVALVAWLGQDPSETFAYEGFN